MRRSKNNSGFTIIDIAILSSTPRRGSDSYEALCSGPPTTVIVCSGQHTIPLLSEMVDEPDREGSLPMSSARVSPDGFTGHDFRNVGRSRILEELEG
jgi:hypothetical protein